MAIQTNQERQAAVPAALPVKLMAMPILMLIHLVRLDFIADLMLGMPCVVFIAIHCTLAFFHHRQHNWVILIHL